MDVDLLRPGNVPISPNTVLWFEFLLNPKLLKEHLRKPYPDPLPTDLLVKFLTLSVEPSVEDTFENTKNFKCSKRHLSMKILALKIVAYWKWDLEMIESKLPLQLQYVLLRDLLCLSSDDPDQNLFVPIMHHNLNFELLRDEQIFAISLYHRWTLHVIVNSPMVSKNVLCSTTTNVESADEIMSKIMDDEGKSEIILQKIIGLRKEFIIIPTFDNISPPTEETDLQQDWANGLKLPASKFYSQVYYDLGTYKVYREITNEAAEYFTLCKGLYDQVKSCKSNLASAGFCEINEDSLNGFCYACGVTIDQKRNLTLQFYAAIRDNYTSIINVLQADNLKREIPLTYRDSLELDLASTLASGKFTASRDLLFQIQTLNVVRRVLEGVSYPSVLDYAFKLNSFSKGNNILTKTLKPLLNSATNTEKQKIRFFLLMLFDKCDSSLVRSIVADSEFSSLFSEAELREARTRFDNDLINFPDLNEVEENRAKKIKMIGNTQLELCLLERQIINTFDPVKLREYIARFSSLSGVRPIMNIYNKWKVAPSLCQAMSTLPSSFLQQYCYVALAKMKELLELQNYQVAQELIAVASEEVKKHKFSQLLSWESLYINMVELQMMWPAPNINRANLSASCKSCLSAAHQGGDPTYLPRPQIRDQCVVTLLNIEREYLANYNFQKRTFPYLDLSITLSLACSDVAKFKGNKKFSKDAWDLIVPAFSSTVPRRQLGIERDLSKVGLTTFFSKLRDTIVINVLLSLLARMHNVLRDEPNLELYFMYAQLWPPNVPNSNAYSPDAVVEIIADIVEEVLHYQPYNGHWLKLSGDINFVKGHNSVALKKYLEALVAASDYFIRPIPKNAVEDFIYKRMIKCCMMLHCYSQAAVLCQFLEEVDYTTAFKCLSETTSADATDCYFDCIWDVNILEFLIALHTKRNEHNKKQKAIDVVGLLELNSNNNDEIKREASNVRKTKFLRAMAKQYIVS